MDGAVPWSAWPDRYRLLLRCVAGGAAWAVRVRHHARLVPTRSGRRPDRGHAAPQRGAGRRGLCRMAEGSSGSAPFIEVRAWASKDEHGESERKGLGAGSRLVVACRSDE